jgi:hypothetical protein
MTVARSVLALVACMVLLAPLGSVAQVRTSVSQPQGSEGTHAPARFDIDAQALATALRAFSEASGTAVLFDDSLVADRQTRGIHGEASPRDALRILLVGTGLDARFSSMNAFTVTLPDNAPAEPLSVAKQAGVGELTLDNGAAGVLQAAIEHALCAHAATRPGTFRLAMQLWIDPAGSVANAVALAPSDDPARDDNVLSAVRGVRVPSTLHRFSPVTVLLTPTAGRRDPCREPGAWEG